MILKHCAEVSSLYSFAYSSYDRHPGNVDITEAPLSFQLGLSDHLELFFNTDLYRKVRPRNPQNLSSFYLPNSTAFVGCVPSAIISLPVFVSAGGVTLAALGAPLGRPTGPPCNPGGQPVAPFPFVGAVGPNFGVLGSNFAPPFVTRLGPVTGGGTGWRGAAALFSGIGSPVGSILPGVILTSRTIPANLTFDTLTIPDLFTIEPSYLPDAPFISDLNGETSFSTITAGGKVRFTGPRNPLEWAWLGSIVSIWTSPEIWRVSINCKKEPVLAPDQAISAWLQFWMAG